MLIHQTNQIQNLTNLIENIRSARSDIKLVSSLEAHISKLLDNTESLNRSI